MGRVFGSILGDPKIEYRVFPPIIREYDWGCITPASPDACQSMIPKTLERRGGSGPQNGGAALSEAAVRTCVLGMNEPPRRPIGGRWALKPATTHRGSTESYDKQASTNARKLLTCLSLRKEGTVSVPEREAATIR